MFRKKKRPELISYDGPPTLPEPFGVRRQSFTLENLQKVYGHSEDSNSTAQPNSSDSTIAQTSYRHGNFPSVSVSSVRLTDGQAFDVIEEEEMRDVDKNGNTEPIAAPRIKNFSRPLRAQSSQQAFRVSAPPLHTQSDSSRRTTSPAATLPWSFAPPPQRPEAHLARHSDFRLSTSAWVRMNEDAARRQEQQQLAQTRRQLSLKRGKAPIALRIMVLGPTGTGKTSWVKSFVESLEPLGAQGDQQQTQSKPTGHQLRPTRKFTSLEGIEFSPATSLLNNAVDATVDDDDKEVVMSHENLSDAQLRSTARRESASTNRSKFRRRASSRASLSSAYLSLGSSAPPQKVSLSIIDTPALPRDSPTSANANDDLTIPSFALPIVDEITGRYMRTLQEEGKLNRLPTRSSFVEGQHVHLVLWFIDPREVLEGEWWHRIKEEQRRDREWKTRRTSLSRGADLTTNPASTVTITTVSGGPDGEAARAHRHHRSGSLGRRRKTSLRAIRSVDGVAEGVTSKEVQLARSASENTVPGSSDHVHGRQQQQEDAVLIQDDEVYTPTLSPMQRQTLRHILPLVPVMPIIARSDALTTHELQTVREGVKRGWNDVVAALKQRRTKDAAGGEGEEDTTGDTYLFGGDEGAGDDTDGAEWEWDWLKCSCGGVAQARARTDSRANAKGKQAESELDGTNGNDEPAGNDDRGYTAAREDDTLFSHDTPTPRAEADDRNNGGITDAQPRTSSSPSRPSDPALSQRPSSSGSLSSPSWSEDQSDPRLWLGVDHIVPSSLKLNTRWPLAIFSPEMATLPSAPRIAGGNGGSKSNIAAEVPASSAPTHFARLYDSPRGTLQLLDPSHCDFLLLRCVLLGTHTSRILASSKARYEMWRRDVVSRARGGGGADATAAGPARPVLNIRRLPSDVR